MSLASNIRTSVDVNEAILNRNETLAARNRALFREHGVHVLNLLSSPGSGKTALLERTLAVLAGELRMAVVVGDLATDNDAERMRRTGAPAVQITTGDVCHLEAGMVARAVQKLDLGALDLLFIENVGNLVCPCAYDLGEDGRVVLLSVTEGEDKPIKYPATFKSADIVIVTKNDIAEAVEYNRALALRTIHGVAPQAEVIEVSARTGNGMDDWYSALKHMVPGQRRENVSS